MTRLRILLAFLVFALSGAISTANAAAKWLRADTHNFIIYSSGDKRQTQQLAENVERFDALMRLRTNIQREENPNRLTIYMLADSGDVARIMGDKSGMIAGIYLPRSDGSFTITNRERANSQLELSGNTVLFHEYAHHFMFRYYNAAYPSWYIEGFAEYVSTATFKPNGEWMLGRPAYHRAFGLLETRPVPIEALLFGRASNTDAAAGDAFYGRAWLFVHMLMMDPPWKGKMTRYMELVGGGKPPREAAVEAFGDLKELDKALDKYLARSKVSVISSTRAVAVDGPIALTELDPLNSQLVALNLKRRVGSEPLKTRDLLRALSAQAPGNAEVWFELAQAELELSQSSDTDAGKVAGATAADAAVERALAIDPDHVRANVFKARRLFTKLQDAGNFTATPWRDARNFLLRANAKANLDPEPLLAWYESFEMQGKEPPKNAADGLALAFNLAPEASDLRVKYAFDLVRQNNYDAAIGLLEILAYDPHGGTQGRDLIDRLKRMRDGQGGKAAGDKPDEE
jgi:hypothetical protein